MKNTMKYFLVILLVVQLASVEGWRRRRRSPPPPPPPPPTTPPEPHRGYIPPHIAQWTDWRSTFRKICSNHNFVSRVRRVHYNYQEDRSWAFYCAKDHRISQSCYYSGWVNTFDNDLIYQCPYGVLTGVHSKYSKPHRDRVYDFQCCRTPNYAYYGCKWTSNYVNDWDAEMDYRVPWRRFLVGAYSRHDNRKEDRKWKFLVCYLKRHYKKY